MIKLSTFRYQYSLLTKLWKTTLNSTSLNETIPFSFCSCFPELFHVLYDIISKFVLFQMIFLWTKTDLMHFTTNILITIIFSMIVVGECRKHSKTSCYFLACYTKSFLFCLDFCLFMNAKNYFQIMHTHKKIEDEWMHLVRHPYFVYVRFLEYFIA